MKEFTSAVRAANRAESEVTVYTGPDSCHTEYERMPLILLRVSQLGWTLPSPTCAIPSTRSEEIPFWHAARQTEGVLCPVQVLSTLTGDLP